MSHVANGITDDAAD